MVRKYILFIILLAINIVLLANNSGINNKKPVSDSLVNKNLFINNQPEPIRYNYLESPERLSNSIYLDNPYIASNNQIIDSARRAFALVTANNAWIDNITNNIAMQTPFGMSRTISPHTTIYQIAVANISFNSTSSVARVFARVLPNGGSNGELYFAGNIALSRIGGVGNNNILTLIGNQNINYNNNTISLNLNGSGNSQTTQFIFDCNGFTSINLNATIQLNSDTYFPVDTTTFNRIDNRKITSNNFSISMNKWEDVYKDGVSFTGVFGNARIPNYFFRINTAVVDLTTLQNPNGTDVSAYIRRNITSLANTWTGLGITSMDVLMPKYFNVRNATNRTRATAGYGVIDNNGFTFKINARDVLTLDAGRAGSANGWPLSISSFNLLFEKDAIVSNSSSFSGKIVLPLEDETFAERGMPFTATFKTSDLRNPTAAFDITSDAVSFLTAKSWRGYIFPDASSIKMEFAVRNDKFYPKVTLSGTYGLFTTGPDDRYDPSEIKKKADEEKAEKKAAAKGKTAPLKKTFELGDIDVEDIVMQTETAPFLTVKSFGAEAELEIGSFSAQAAFDAIYGQGPGKTSNSNSFCIHIDADVQFADGKFGGGLGIDLYSTYNANTGRYDFTKFELGRVNINADFKQVKIDGSLDFLRSPAYGEGFSGNIRLTVAKTVEITAGAMFGAKKNTDGSTLDYFNVDASVKFSPGVLIFGGVKLRGFSGGITYKMDPITASSEYPVTASGVSYRPNENSFFRLRAGVFLSLVKEELLSGWGGLEFVFNKNWGLDEVSISGSAQIFSQPANEDKSRISPLTKGSQQSRRVREENLDEAEAESNNNEIETALVTPQKRSNVSNFATGYTSSGDQAGDYSLKDTFSVYNEFVDFSRRTAIAKTNLDTATNRANRALAAKARPDSILDRMIFRSERLSAPGSSDLVNNFNAYANIFNNGSNRSSVSRYSYYIMCGTEWQQVCTLLNIPFIPSEATTSTRRANYTEPTLARITQIRDSLNSVHNATIPNIETLKRAFNDSITNLRRRNRSIDSASNYFENSFYYGSPQWSINLSESRARQIFGFKALTSANESFNVNINNSIKTEKSANETAIALFNRRIDSLPLKNRNGELAGSKPPLLQVFSDFIRSPSDRNTFIRNEVQFNQSVGDRTVRTTTSYPLISQVKLHYDYYMQVLLPRFRIEDSITNYKTNIIAPLQAAIDARVNERTQAANIFNPLRNRLDTLTIVNTANQLARRANPVRIRKRVNPQLSSIESNLIDSSDAANELAAPIVNAWNYKAKQVDLRNRYNTALVRIRELKDLIANRATSAANRVRFSNELTNLEAQFKADEATINENTLATNGGPLIEVSKRELYYINRNYRRPITTTVTSRLKALNDNIDLAYNAYVLRYNQISMATGRGVPSSYSDRSINANLVTQLSNLNVASRDKSLYMQANKEIFAAFLINNTNEGSLNIYQDRNRSLNIDGHDSTLAIANRWIEEAGKYINDSMNRASPVTSTTRVTRVGTQPEGNPSYWGDFVVKIDIKNNSFSLSMDVYASIDIAGVEVASGDMGNKKAGTLDFHYASNTFYLNIGTRDNPCSIQYNYGNFIQSKGTMYLMVSNGESGNASQASNFRLRFGMSSQVSASATKDLLVCEAFAEVGGRVSFELDAARYTNFTCSGNNQVNGLLDGWYGSGRLRASAFVRAGIRNDLGTAEIIRGDVSINLEVRGPKPLYFQGTVAFSYSVLGVSGSTSVDVRYGTYCRTQFD